MPQPQPITTVGVRQPIGLPATVIGIVAILEAQIAVARQLLRQEPFNVVGQAPARSAQQTLHVLVRLALRRRHEQSAQPAQNVSSPDSNRRAPQNGAIISGLPVKPGGAHGSISYP
jgi:hypothetical protein